MDTVTYREAAAAGFDSLQKQFVPEIFEGNFWFAGNAFHSCLSYLLLAEEKDPCEIVPRGYDIYEKWVGTSDWWHDDYAWWGNAFTLALANRTNLGYAGVGPKLFNNIDVAAKNCWELLEKCWSDTPYSAKDDHAVASADIKGGAFNTQEDLPMAGRNCVTNEGFWLLSLHLARLHADDPRYKARANSLSNWFKQWLGRPTNGLLGSHGLALERPTGNGSCPQWYWSGDQGLLIAAFGPNAAIAGALATKVTSSMTDRDGVLHENLSFAHECRLGEFLADYATGKGIFMRNLVGLNDARPGRPYSKFILTNAASVWQNRLSNEPFKPQFSFNWNWRGAPGYECKKLECPPKSAALCNLIMQAAGQDALTASLSVAADVTIAEPQRRDDEAIANTGS